MFYCLLLIRPQEIYLNEILIIIKKCFYQKNAYENVVCKIAGHLVQASMCELNYVPLHRQ